MSLSRKLLLCLMLVLTLPVRAEDSGTLDSPNEIADTVRDQHVHGSMVMSLLAVCALIK